MSGYRDEDKGVLACHTLLTPPGTLAMASLLSGLELPHLSPLEICGIFSLLLVVSYLRRRSDPVCIQAILLVSHVNMHCL